MKYGLLIVALIVGIVLLWPKNKTVVTKLDPKMAYSSNSLSIEGKPPVDVKTYSGTIKTWDYLKDTLTVEIGGKLVEFKIDPTVTKVYLTPARNTKGSVNMSLVDKAKNPDHWPGAFCVGDGATITVDSKTGVIVQVFGTGFRACGFGGKIK